MANKKHKSIASVNDRYLVYDGKNYVYADGFTGDKGYILTSNETEKFVIYSSRYALGLSVGILLFFLTNQVVLSIVLGLLTYVVFEVLFRTRFLKTLPVIEKYNKPKAKGIVEGLVDKHTKMSLILMALLMGGIVILIPVNIHLQNYTGTLLYCNYIIFAALLIYEIIIIIALIKKINTNK